MAERQWAEAATDFFEAFKNYDEAGNQRRIQCLKYAVSVYFFITLKPYYCCFYKCDAHNLTYILYLQILGTGQYAYAI